MPEKSHSDSPLPPEPDQSKRMPLSQIESGYDTEKDRRENLLWEALREEEKKEVAEVEVTVKVPIKYMDLLGPVTYGDAFSPTGRVYSGGYMNRGEIFFGRTEDQFQKEIMEAIEKRFPNARELVSKFVENKKIMNSMRVAGRRTRTKKFDEKEYLEILKENAIIEKQITGKTIQTDWYRNRLDDLINTKEVDPLS